MKFIQLSHSSLTSIAYECGYYDQSHFIKAFKAFSGYGMALWWTAMRVITAGNEFSPSTPEGRGLAFLIAIFGYTVFGYVTATFATFFIGRDAEEKDAPVAGAKDVSELKQEIMALKKSIDDLRGNAH